MKASPITRVINGFGLVLLFIIFAMPFVWMASTAFKSLGETLTFPPVWIPETLLWENFAQAWNSGPFLKYLSNSIIVTLFITPVDYPKSSSFQFMK
ncbi:ABC transporter permease family protein [Planococcus lenghuensis]|uniref:Carbohydrate ABC transporter permease n=1 Tax=Planococcus lenghuensis TaxID=2213202 RepID=A0A1Q2L5U1_9BACL|nr:hypothetical protein [Planococcus lenghuensis]AQQ55467.1 hypothetical protein B0X71_20145 [Planococcus lenghuensis]